MTARPGKSSFPHLDGLRGLAALSILAYHGLGGNYRTITGWVEMGAALRSALPLFFFLSAFLLYRPYVAARLEDASRPELRAFWWRRFLRIVPAYWLALTLIAVTVGLPGVFGPEGWRYYTFTYIYSHGTVTGGLIPAWTLCVDMTFYLALPFFALAIDRLWRRLSLRAAIRTELAILTAIWLASTAYWFVFVSGAHVGLASMEMRETNLLANLNWFTLGMALAVVSATDAHRPSPLTRLLHRRHAGSVCWGAAAITFVILARTYYVTGETTRHLLALVFCAFVFAPAALAPRQRGPHQVLARRRLAWLGVISYGIYLYHGPVINELEALGVRLGTHGLLTYLSLVAVTLAIVIPLGAASYRLLEHPLMRWGRRVRPQRATGSAGPLGTQAFVVASPEPTTAEALTPT